MRNERLNNDIEDPLSKRNYLLKINQLLSSKDCSERDRNILLSLKSWGDEILN
jgi:hypothetical protein